MLAYVQVLPAHDNTMLLLSASHSRADRTYTVWLAAADKAIGVLRAGL